MLFLAELGLQVGLLRAAAAGAGRVAALRHEAGDDTVEDDAVVEARIRQIGDARDMAGSEIGAQLDGDVAAVEGQGQGLRVGHDILRK